MELTADNVKAVIGDFHARCEIIKAVGGIAEIDRVNGTRIPPANWCRDEQTDYWVPPGLTFEGGTA